MLGTFFYQLWSRSFQFPIHWIRPKAVSFPNELPRQPIWDVKVFGEHRNCYPLKSTDLQHWHSFVKVTCSMRLLKLETRMMTGVTWNKWAANFSTPDQIAATLHCSATEEEEELMDFKSCEELPTFSFSMKDSESSSFIKNDENWDVAYFFFFFCHGLRKYKIMYIRLSFQNKIYPWFVCIIKVKFRYISYHDMHSAHWCWSKN